MKKLLALVLALVMSLSLVTISNAAFKDAEDISYDEAVAVLNAVGVLAGDEKGNFNPTDKLTREAAAKVIAYLALGADVAEALPAVKVFDDVEADRWSAKYIAYCAQEGIINGVGDNKFNPTGELSGYAFAKMLFCALGYNASNEGFLGNGWEIAVAQMLKSDVEVGKVEYSLDLSDGVSGALSAALTREQAAQYMLNMIQLPMVTGYENKGSTNITIGDVVISTNPGDAVYGDVYMEENYEKLDLDEDYDNFGRATRTWTYDGDDVWEGVVATAEASYTGKVKSSTIYKDLGLKKVTDAAVKVNGVDAKDFTLAKKDADGGKEKIGAVGAVVEVYKDGDDYTIVVVNYTVDEIDEVKETTYKKDGSVKKDAHIKLDSGLIYETEKFTEDDEDAVVLVALYKGAVEDVIVAESVEGKVSSINKDGDAVIGGTAYVIDCKDVEAGSKGTFYLNVDDSIVKFDGEKSSSDKFAYVYAYDKNDGSVNEDGLSTDDTYTVFYVDDKGVKGKAVAEDFADLCNAGKFVKGVYAYSINSDDEFEVEKSDDLTALAGKNIAISKDNKKVSGKYMTADTEFVFVDIGEKKVTTSVVTGYKNVNVKVDATSYIVYDEDNYAVVVFVDKKAAALDEDGANFLLDAAYSVSVNDDDNKVYTFDVMIDGEETTLDSLKKDIFSKVDAGDKFSYDVDNDGYVTKVEKDTDYVTVTVDKVVEDVLYVQDSDDKFDLEDDTVIYKLADEDGYKLGAPDCGDVAYFTEISKLAEDDVVRVYTNSSDEVTFVIVVVQDVD